MSYTSDPRKCSPDCVNYNSNDESMRCMECHKKYAGMCYSLLLFPIDQLPTTSVVQGDQVLLLSESDGFIIANVQFDVDDGFIGFTCFMGNNCYAPDDYIAWMPLPDASKVKLY